MADPKYIEMRDDGATPEEVAFAAIAQRGSFIYGAKVIIEVFKMHLIEAKPIAIDAFLRADAAGLLDEHRAKWRKNANQDPGDSDPDLE